MGFAALQRRTTAADAELGALQFMSAAFSHAGSVREQNEDAYLDLPEKGLWAVADGMGGHLAGGLASSMVVNALASVQPHSSAFAFCERVRMALSETNDRLRAKAIELLTDVVGATVAAFLVHGRHYACIWAGDCRVYRLRDGMLTLLTRDHTIAQQMTDAGLSGNADEAHHVTRAVGAYRVLELETASGQILPGDRFLLCSDGATVLDLNALGEVMRDADVRNVPFLAMKRALDGVARDNVTFVAIEAR